MTNVLKAQLQDLHAPSGKQALPSIERLSNETTVLKGKFADIVKALTIIEEEKEHKKEVIAELYAAHGIPPKVSNKLAKILHKGGLKEETDLVEYLERLHTLIAG